MLNLRAIFSDGEIPNSNDPADVPPATVGPPAAVPGDPHGVVIVGDPPPPWLPPRIVPSAWSGWPDGWQTPLWGSSVQPLTDIAWNCIDKNASALASMPPYLVGNAPPSLSSLWLENPDPDLYVSWDEFMKQLSWDYQLGEAFVIATAWYNTGFPARFHVCPPWSVTVEMDDGRRRYTIGGLDVTSDILHIRYQGGVADPHGHGPLEAGQYRVVAAQALMQYGARLVSSGGIPVGVLESQEEISPEQATLIQQAWVARRMSTLGEPAVLDKGLQWKPSQLNPTDMGLVELEQYHAGRIASLLGVPGPLVGLPGGGDSLTYSTMEGLFAYHWRDGLKPKANQMMRALSGWALPRGTELELNRDAYIQPGPYERAQTAQIYFNLVDPQTGQRALSIDEIRAMERFDNGTPAELAQGVLR